MAAMMAARDDEMDDDPSDRMEEEGSHAGSFAPSEAPPANISTYEAPRDTLADARARAAMTVVIQPGSSVLRIGRASDPSPCIVPHVIARLCTGAAAEEAATRKIPETEGDVAERQREIAESASARSPKSHARFLGETSSAARSSTRGAAAEEAVKRKIPETVERGMKRWSGPTRGPTKGGAGNPSLGVEEEVVESSDAFEFLGFSPGNMAATYVGADALKVSCAAREDGARYVVRSPMRRGRLVQRASPQEQISDLVAIWEHAIRDVVGLSRTEVTGMACVLVVPANVCKTDTKLLVDLVINELRFRSILIVQDASCAAFQANAHTACVVDIGATKTSVTAVEDGLCMPSSCFLLGYGTDDISRLFLALLQRGAKGDQAVLEPFEQSEPVHREAFRIFRDNVLQLLAPQQDILAKSEDIILQFPKRAGKASLHRVRVGSSAFVAPMGLFYPKLLAPLDWSAAERKPWFEAQDLMDDDYIADMLANRPGGTGSLQADDKLLLRDDQQFPPGDVPPGALPDMIRDAIAKVVALHEANKHADGEQRRENKSLEASQRLWGNIILTGGGAHIKGIVEALELRLNKMRPHDVDKMKALELRLNKMRPHDVDKMKVVTGPPNAVEGDHPHLSWSGGALVAAVESYKEFRVSREEWDQRGIGALRERVFFPW